MRCPRCRSDKTKTRHEVESFLYGSSLKPESQVRLTATVPVHVCDDCGLSFTGPAADNVRDEAIQTHLAKK